jgi:hypothetical protein
MTRRLISHPIRAANEQLQRDLRAAESRRPPSPLPSPPSPLPLTPPTTIPPTPPLPARAAATTPTHSGPSASTVTPVSLPCTLAVNIKIDVLSLSPGVCVCVMYDKLNFAQSAQGGRVLDVNHTHTLLTLSSKRGEKMGILKVSILDPSHRDFFAVHSESIHDLRFSPKASLFLSLSLCVCVFETLSPVSDRSARTTGSS